MIPIDFNWIISTITDVVSPGAFIKDKFQRNEIVIKLLKKFNLDPEHPPADFSGVYAYALVEYGVGKPKVMLELFRQNEIQQIYRKAFAKNNPAILLKEGEEFLATYALGDEIRDLGIDPRREFAAFAAVFMEVAKRTRTPAEVLTNQQIDTLHKRIGNVQERLDRLPTLEGIRTEMARLVQENYPALPAAEILTENKCRAFALSQQMRGWFETLGYRFETYEIWEEDYFEWIINIPARRGYDRVLVRGIQGEAGIKDIVGLRDSVQGQRTKEGWLITIRRISRAARDAVEIPEYNQLFCYTFDELLDETADFSGYLDWLEAEVKRREIEHKYVPLACIKEELDSVTKRRIAVSCYAEQDGWIDGYIDLWMDDPVKEHISILGEFGTGKTWFAFHYASMALQRYRDAKKSGLKRPRLPLVIPLRDYAKAVSVESLFSEFFFRKHEIGLPGYSAFEQLNRMGKLLLIFDGFDEMVARVDRQKMINNFWELVKIVLPGAKVILTCRTEHFPESKEGRALLNAELQASTANLTIETPQFEVLELEKFNDEQIRQVFELQAETATVEQIMGNSSLLDLARRPVMTELILEALPDIEAGKPVDMSRVYLYAVRRKMERDIKAERTFTSLADKLYFLCELSWEMLSTNQMSLNYRLFPDRIRRLFGAVVREEKDLDHWHFDMMGQTMLIRNADGDYTPAHRSLLEFFVAYKFAAQLGALSSDFTELAQLQSHLAGSAAQDYSWSSYFGRRMDGAGEVVPIASLRGFVGEDLGVLRGGFGVATLTKAVMDLLLPMLEPPQPSLVRREQEYPLLDILEATRGKNEAEVGYVGGNAATLLVKVDQAALEGRNLSGAVIKGADFSNASLRHVNLEGANLADSVFTKNIADVLSVVFSPDGNLLATGGTDGMVRLWEAASGREILSCKGHTDWVRSVAFSPDGKTLASGSADQTVRLWNISTGEYLKTFQEHTSRVYSLAFSPDGKTLASGSADQTVKLWNINTGECLKTFQEHTSWVYSLAFSPDGKTLASVSSDRTVTLWDISTSECLKTLQGHDAWISSVAFSPNGKALASASADQTVKLWNISTGECLKTLQGHIGWVYSLALSLDGKALASASADQTVKLWNISTGDCLKTLQGHTSKVRSVAFSPDGQFLVSGGDDKTVRLWDISTGECLKTLQGHSNWVRSVAFSPDGQFLVSGSDNSTVRLWDISTGECRKTFQGHIYQVFSVAFSPKGKTLASGSSDPTVKIWDISTGKYLKILKGHKSWVRSVAFSPDGETLASGSDDKTVRLWNISTGECLKILEGHKSWVRSVVFSPDGETLASGSDDKTVRFWNISTGEYLKTLEGHTNSISSVTFSPDGQTLASGSDDKTVRLWDISTGECLKTLHKHTSAASSVAFNSEGNMLVTGSYDETVKLWDIRIGECLHTFDGHTNQVLSVAFSLDGQTLASGSSDETIKLWNVKTGECFKTLINKPYAGMNITGAIGLTETQKATLKALGAVEEEK